jgi:DNA-binding response OmpR family regulator/DNA-binding CsgD family transcriptional regulator
MTQPFKKRTILIVDDNVTNLKVVVAHLKAYSYTILTASTGEAGLERAQLTEPDLILLDVKMPGIDGVETCRRLKANPATSAIPVIFMTALGDTDDKVRGLEAGAVDYITKPIEAAELLARVQTHLTLHDLQRRLEARVLERTEALTEEVTQRKRSQEEKELLLDLVRQQSEQLRHLTQQSLDNQTERDAGLAQALRDQVDVKLGALERNLNQARHWLHAQEAHDPALKLAQEQIEQALRTLSEIRQQTRRVTDHLRNGTPAHQHMRDNPLFKLSTREYEVLQLIVQGKSNAEIAELLAVTKPTVSTYRTRVMNKLGLDDLPALMKFAVEHRLIS